MQLNYANKVFHFLFSMSFRLPLQRQEPIYVAPPVGGGVVEVAKEKDGGGEVPEVPVVAPTSIPMTKAKRVASQKQLDALKRGQEKRTANIEERKIKKLQELITKNPHLQIPPSEMNTNNSSSAPPPAASSVTSGEKMEVDVPPPSSSTSSKKPKKKISKREQEEESSEDEAPKKTKSKKRPVVESSTEEESEEDSTDHEDELSEEEESSEEEEEEVKKRHKKRVDKKFVKKVKATDKKKKASKNIERPISGNGLFMKPTIRFV